MPTAYEETVWPPPWAMALIAALAGVAVWIAATRGGPVWWLPMPLLLPFGLIFACFGRLVIRAEGSAVTASFGLFGWPSQRVERSEIAAARPVTYRPILNFGGWGLRAGRFEGEPTAVYSLRGNRGLLVELTRPRRVALIRTTRFLLGASEPERLAVAIQLLREGLAGT